MVAMALHYARWVVWWFEVAAFFGLLDKARSLVALVGAGDETVGAWSALSVDHRGAEGSVRHPTPDPPHQGEGD